MSQEQRRRDQEQPITYGDVFAVSGDLASKPIAPRDAAMMQSAETAIFGQTQKAGPAAAMQAAATQNEQMAQVRHTDVTDVTDVAAVDGVTVAETDVPGARMITESVGRQIIGQCVEATLVTQVDTLVGAVEQKKITIGEALEAAVQTAGDRPVTRSDAAAIQAAESRATGNSLPLPGGLASSAQAAANYNAFRLRHEDGVKLRDVLSGATMKLPADKAASRQDAEGVASAEMRNNLNLDTSRWHSVIIGCCCKAQ